MKKIIINKIDGDLIVTLKTIRAAVNKTLKIWKYLVAHPEIADKDLIPDLKIRKILDTSDWECPLCDLFNDTENYTYASCRACAGCPLKEMDQHCVIRGSAFSNWIKSHKNKNPVSARKSAAQLIVDSLVEWTNKNKKMT